MTTKPAIVVIGFNRPASIRRLLSSLERARYSTTDVPLVISIDFAGTESGGKTRRIAEEFQWSHGQKHVIFHEKNQGLRSHVLQCGDLVNEYGSVIMLEDDVTVGPEFYQFAVAALEFSETDKNLGGVSLYNHRTNFLCQLPFEPLYDGFDNFYLQIAQSWGQAWTQEQWNGFRTWYDGLSEVELEQIPSSVSIPQNIARWPKSSWLKYFVWYLVKFDKFFLYPRHSHSTNNSDPGHHTHHPSSTWQVPLAFKLEELRFSTVEQADAIYDSFFEILPDRLKKLAPALNNYEFDVDLYGSKPLSQLTKPYVLTSKSVNGSPELAFDLAFKPMVANFFEPSNRDSATLSLASRERLRSESKISMSSLYHLQYFFAFVPVRTILKSTFKYFLQTRMRSKENGPVT